MHADAVQLSMLLYIMSPGIVLLAALVFHQASAFGPYLRVYPPVNTSDGRTPLYFGLVQSLGSSNFDGSGSVAGVEVALDLINSDTNVLPEYTLHYTLGNSSCDGTMALTAFFDQITQAPTKVAYIGSGCSVATEPTAAISHFYNITHLSCVSSSAALENRDRFRYYYQLLNSEASITYAYFATIRQYQWSRVALIVQNENLFTEVSEPLIALLTAEEIKVSERIFDSDDGVTSLGDGLFEEQARIYVIVTYATAAREILCEAFRRGIHYPRHLFITPAWYVPNWWLVEDQNYSCSALERASIMPLTLGVLHFDFIEQLGNIDTNTGISSQDYGQLERAHLGIAPLNLTQLDYSQYCYDATWTLAYALDNTVRDLVRENSSLSLQNYTYDNDVLLGRVMGHVESTNFTGVTGQVKFNVNGIRNINTLRVYQYRDYVQESGSLTQVEIAQVKMVENETEFTYVEGESDETTWPDGIPYDGVPINQIVSIHVAVSVIFFVLATVGIAFAVFCIIFNFIFRNKKLIRLTSPKLNYIILAGAIIIYFDIYFVVVPTTNPSAVSGLCNTVPWLTAIGYSLCFGTIVVKTFRVYYIFTNPSPSQKLAAKDRFLALAVCGLLVIDFVILITYTVVAGLLGQLGAKEIPNGENPMDITGNLGIITRYYVYICDTTARDVFLGILYGYKALLQFAALFLAFATRKVKIKGLDDAKYIAGAIYVTSIVLAVVIVATYSTKDLINTYTVIFSAGNWIGVTVVLTLVFVTKMVALYRDPEGDRIFDRTEIGQAAKVSASMTGTGEPHTLTNGNSQDLERMRIRVTELENLLEDYRATNGHIDTKEHVQSPATVSSPKVNTFSDILATEGDTRTIWDEPQKDQIEASTRV